MPPPSPDRKPLRPITRVPAPAPRKKFPLAAILIALVVLGGGGVAAFVALNSKPEVEVRVKAPAPVTPTADRRFHNRDLGAQRKATLLITSNVRIKAEEFSLIDAEGKKHEGSRVDGADYFLDEIQRKPGALAVAFRVPAASASLEC